MTRDRALLLVQMLLLAARDYRLDAGDIRQPRDWSRVVNLACQYGSGFDPPVTAQELTALATQTIGDVFTPERRGGVPDA
jgi:hypothetical protein